MYNFSLLYYIVLDLGITNFNNRTIAQQPNLLRQYLPNFLILKTLLSFVYLALVFGFAYLWGYEAAQFSLLLPLALNQIFIAFIAYFRSNVSALQHFRLDALLSVTDRVLVILVVGALLWGNFVSVFKIEYFIYAQTFAYGVTLLLSWGAVWAIRPRNVAAEPPQTAQNRRIYAELLMIIRQTYPYALLVLLMTIYNRIDAVMLEKMLPDGAAQVGIYAAAYRLLDAVNIFGILFGSLLLPIFSKLLIQKSNVRDLTLLAFQLIFAFSATVAVCSAFFGAEIMGLLYADSDAVWVRVFELLIFSFVPISSVYIFGTLLTANANLRQLNGIALAGVFVNISLNVLLIPKMQVYGATLATLLTQIGVALVHIAFAKNIFKIHFSKKWLSQLLLFVLILVGSNFLIKFLIQAQWITLRWEMAFVLSNLSAIGAALLTKLIDLKGFVEILKQKTI